MGLHVKQFKKLILDPTLDYFSPEINNSNCAKLLTLETIWHESGGLIYLAQFPYNGPAKGICQMEKPTFEWLVDFYMGNSLIYPKFSTIFGKPSFDDLIWNLKLCVAMCRIRYYVMPNPLPEDNIQARAKYWGQHFQTTNDPVKISQYIAHAYDLHNLL